MLFRSEEVAVVEPVPPVEEPKVDEIKTEEEFFERARLVAQALDAEAAARQADEANAILAEIEIAEPELDIIAADAEHIALLEAKQQETQTALDTIIEKYNELAAEKDNLTTNVSFLQRQSDQRQLDLLEAQTENTTLAQAVVEIESQLIAAEQAAEQLRQRIAELEQAAQVEVVEPEMGSDLAELEKLQAEFDNLMVLEEEPAEEPPVEEVAVTESHVEDAIHAYDDERLVTKNDKIELADTTPRPFVSRGGVQSNYDLLKATRSAPPPQVYQDDIPESGNAGFGVRFPETASKGDMWLRVDMNPNRAYKFNGIKWIEVDKNKTDRFVYDKEYIRHLHEGLVSGEYDLDDLNDTERAQVEQFRNNTLL